jgi:hypothetical protein
MKKVKLNKAERKVLLRYVLDRGGDLGLPHWIVNLSRWECPQGNYAVVQSNLGKNEALIAFQREFRKADPKQQRQTVIHELLHLHHQGTATYLTNTLPRVTGRKLAGALYDVVHQREEEAVDALARAIAPHYPLIEWPK